MRWLLVLLATITMVAGGLSVYALAVSNHQRGDACQAVLVSLEGTARNAKAGIRSVPPVMELRETFAGEQLAFALQQRQSTLAENKRRARIITEMEDAANELRQSGFCP